MMSDRIAKISLSISLSPLSSKCTNFLKFFFQYIRMKKQSLLIQNMRKAFVLVLQYESILQRCCYILYATRHAIAVYNKAICLVECTKKKYRTPKIDEHIIYTSIQLRCGRQELNLHTSQNMNQNSVCLPKTEAQPQRDGSLSLALFCTLFS